MKIEDEKIYIKYKDKNYTFNYKENEKLKIDIAEIKALKLQPYEKAELLEEILDNFYDIPIKSKKYYITYFIEKYTLDFTNCKNKEEFYDIIENSFYFPEYFGRNMDAVWDCIAWEIDKSKPIEIIGINKLTGYTKILSESFLLLINNFIRKYPNSDVKIVAK